MKLKRINKSFLYQSIILMSGTIFLNSCDRNQIIGIKNSCSSKIEIITTQYIWNDRKRDTIKKQSFILPGAVIPVGNTIILDSNDIIFDCLQVVENDTNYTICGRANILNLINKDSKGSYLKPYYINIKP
jgi:hypothetical protein